MYAQPARMPAYRLTIDGQTISPQFDARLQRLALTEERAGTADQLDLVLSDHDGALAFPRRGVILTLAMGWDGEPLQGKGTFVVDEAEHGGPPDLLTIRARSADVQTMKQRRSQAWHATTLGQIIETLAGRNNLAPRIAAVLASRAVAHLDQAEESDLAFLTRLGKLHDAVATVKHGRLLLLPVTSGQNSQGQQLEGVTIARSDGSTHRYQVADRETWRGVRAYWQDSRAARRKSELAGSDPPENNGQNVKRLLPTYANQAEAQAAANAEWERLQRGKATLSLNLAEGQPLLTPQAPVTVRGFKAEIDAHAWRAARVTHELAASAGWTTQVELETD
ncbi:phage late control protein [Hylemonella gracilis str. Niagara R]|uniref:Phage late control protein n=1 Tax=Hylemonella gracilis str. Niagara R TaxID=1458275 RepID=A0A016XIQ1_9BURK|nr:contractile injection system protein, VgrG/Pvc8 family [Hylemonella gracilis]EYC51442.1 phage late control protein [Hylemonella gracilis str. Niagara R]